MADINLYDASEVPFLQYASSINGSVVSLSSANQIAVYTFILPFAMKISNLGIFIGTGDASNLSNVGIYDTAGNLIADVGAQYIAHGPQVLALTNPIVLGPGTYLLAFTSAGTTLTFAVSNPTYSLEYWSTNGGSVSSGGVFPSTITLSTGLGEGQTSPYQGYPPVVAFM